MNLKNRFQFKDKPKIQAIIEAVKGQGLRETIWKGWNFVGIKAI